ncbi:glycerophosphoryl diester phosphodiesterase membrane domain-containing protein [Streptomyces scabiei]|uniref:glycerophosphoryl diester phosphodiesterase membrane domain-containing protein n=6 Tax=Streptomyces scabiei TaxID=1930 RepID=UPI001B31D030|nr:MULTISPECIES: glycerophosphoryl diester phosphodiesterase membrane domain-containing protein [Streptomyces]MBP5893278.1 hypothetical protein [Streptomyces sp. LBUM 1481]MBP5923526.1 hypothetical protein [Streptomyces sp. LBUM 1483]MDX2581730.1 glycerophosphoryl diester phosphodiesterase membrane domain-containing protein [Streptomyces scabiei]MDX2656208.1 glycerophosphoryl diester phosphodiesterase membrane domain-containing protein [Streptomyces scabiei]MDX2722958.1 glycerophosphoryl diest
MKDTPGWASPGSAPSGGQEPDPQGSARPEDRTDADRAQPADQAGPDQAPQQSKWSKEQPPPAQWSAPTPQAPGATPPPPPVPGWGGHPGPGAPGGHGAPGYGTPGWGGGWGGPPPAAKPGVIPLRPLGIGEILDGAVSTMRTHWRTVLGISLAVAVVTQIGVILLQGFVLDDTASADALNDPTATPGELGRALRDTLLSTSVVMVISLLGTIIATALLTTVTSRAVLGRSVTTAEAWRDARPQLLRLAGLTVLLLVIAVLVMAVGVLPGVLLATGGSTGAGVLLALLGGLGAFVLTVWLMIRFSLASPALMLEKQGVRKSLGRSGKLVRGSWWRVLGIQLLAAIIAYIVASIVVIPFSFAGAALDGDGISGLLATGGTTLGWTYLVISGVGAVIGSTLTFPISAGVTVLLYIDQRIRREALDLELGRAAGLQGYGDAPGATPGS